MTIYDLTALGVLAAVLVLAEPVITADCGWSSASAARSRSVAGGMRFANAPKRRSRCARRGPVARCARTRLADAQRALNRVQRGLRTVGGSGSLGTSAGGDPAHADMVRTAQQAVTDAVRALAEQDTGGVRQWRNEMTARRQDVRTCAMERLRGGRWRALEKMPPDRQRGGGEVARLGPGLCSRLPARDESGMREASQPGQAIVTGALEPC